MATDTASILASITSLYDFSARRVVHVGTGGIELIAYAADAQSVLAIDPDAEALERLGEAVREWGLVGRVRSHHGRFSQVRVRADIVLFEFCLHQMFHPADALRWASRTADAILVVDHCPESHWAWVTAATEKARRLWEVVGARPLAKSRRFAAIQRFADIDDLRRRLSSLGEPSLSRASSLSGHCPIEIRMEYRVALLRGTNGR